MEENEKGVRHMNGKRIESYLHSDNSTENKGGSLIELKCETDFGARTDEFKAFAKKIAQLAFGSLSACEATIQ